MKAYDYHLSPTEQKQWTANAVIEGRSMRDAIRAHAVRYAEREACQEVNICTLNGDVVETVGRGVVKTKPDEGI